MNILKKDEALYGVLLTDAQEIGFVEIKPDEDILSCTYRGIGCNTVEFVEPDELTKRGMVMLVDEEGKLREGSKFINCVASFLYGSQEHGDPIVGNAMIVKLGDEQLEMLTGMEAAQLAKEMTELRGKAIDDIADAFHLRPAAKKSISDDLQKSSVQGERRQPCKPTSQER